MTSPYEVIFPRRRTSCSDPLITALQTEPWHVTAWWTARCLMANRLLIYWSEFVSSILLLMCDSSTLNKCAADVFFNSGSFHSPTFQTNVNDDAHSIVINQRSATVYSQSVYLIQSHSGECRSPVSLAFSETAQSVTAISHSMAQPNPVSSHVDCIRIGWPGARLEARGYLSYLWTETWFRKSTWSRESDNSDSLQRTILIALLLKTLPWI